MCVQVFVRSFIRLFVYSHSPEELLDRNLERVLELPEARNDHIGPLRADQKQHVVEGPHAYREYDSGSIAGECKSEECCNAD